MEKLIANEMTMTFKGKDALVRVRFLSKTNTHGEETFHMEVFVPGAGDLTSSQVFDAACRRALAIIQKALPGS